MTIGNLKTKYKILFSLILILLVAAIYVSLKDDEAKVDESTQTNPNDLVVEHDQMPKGTIHLAVPGRVDDTISEPFSKVDDDIKDIYERSTSIVLPSSDTIDTDACVYMNDSDGLSVVNITENNSCLDEIIDNQDKSIDKILNNNAFNVAIFDYQPEDTIIVQVVEEGFELVIVEGDELKPIEKTTTANGNDALVINSLGNFISNSEEDINLVSGILEFDVSFGDNITISNELFTPTYQRYNDDGTFMTMSLDTLAEFDGYEQMRVIEDIARSVIDDKYFLSPTPYSDITTRDDFNNITLVNKNNCLSQSYEPTVAKPNVLENRYSSSSVHVISTDIIGNVEAMFEAAAIDGYDLTFLSGYRDFNLQNGLYNNYAERDGVAGADSYSARPGCSEHQTGYGFDIGEVSSDSADIGSFTGTDAAKWIEDNAHLYGFILRYPKDKQYTTQYTYESWHIRYVGVQAATTMYENDLALEEYLDPRIKH